MDNLSDEALVGEVQKGSIHAFETLVRRYQHKLYIFAYRIVYDQGHAEEIVQDAFVSVYQTIDRIDTTRKFSSYIYTVTKNQAISYLRSVRKDVPLEDDMRISEDTSFYEDLEDSDRKKSIQQAMEKIDVKYRQVLHQYYFEDLLYDEISKRLSIPINTVRTHLRRAKDALRKELEHAGT